MVTSGHGSRTSVTPCAPDGTPRSWPALGEKGSRAFNQLVDLVTDAQSEGWAVGQHPRHAAVVVWSLVHGMATLWTHGGIQSVTGDLDLEQLGVLTETLLLQSDIQLTKGTT